MMEQIVSLTSLLVALAALVIAVGAWRRPFPADPTAIPRFGKPEEPRDLDNPLEVDAFFEFIREYTGRKVLLYMSMSKRDTDNTPNHRLMTDQIAWQNSNGGSNVLHIKNRPDNENAVGIEYRHGRWGLRGYYANAGLSYVGMGDWVYSLTPFSDDEAVA